MANAGITHDGEDGLQVGLKKHVSGFDLKVESLAVLALTAKIHSKEYSTEKLPSGYKMLEKCL